MVLVLLSFVCSTIELVATCNTNARCLLYLGLTFGKERPAYVYALASYR